MNEFVEECRREWKRLHVPDPVANEMAADLEADLAEAEAEGSSPEEVLGTGAFDARSFAAAWATERGVVEVPSRTEGSAVAPSRTRRRAGVLVALAGVGIVSLVAVMGVALALHPFGSSAQAAMVSPARRAELIQPDVPQEQLLPFQAHAVEHRDAIVAVGVGVVVVLGGLITAALVLVYFSPWASSGGWPGRRRHRDQAPDDHHG